MMSSSFIIIIAAFFAVSVFLLAFSLIPQKSDVSKKLEQLEGLKWDTSPEERKNALERIFNDAQRINLQQLLLEAGWYTVTPAQMAFRIVGGCLFGLTVGLAYLFYMKNTDLLSIALAVLLTIGGAILPMSRLKGAVKKRKIAIQKGMPDLMDMLASTVKAGLAFNAALGYAEEVAIGPLGEEVRAVLSEIRLGRSRADALRSMANRVKLQELSTAVTAIVQAERLGSDLSNVLEELSLEGRNRRMMRAEEIAALMPVKMVIPMALFMLPALFVMIFGGIVARYVSGPH